MRSQAALQYLTTYAWAILIISVVLAALFSLGIFNQNSLLPTATPGECYVSRPNGQWTTQFIALKGNCNGQLPEFSSIFNGQSSYIQLNQISSEAGTRPMSFSVWFKTLSIPTGDDYPIIFSDTPPISGSGRNGYDMFVGGAGSGKLGQLGFERFYSSAGVVTNTISALSLNTWYFAVGTYDGSNIRLYVNGALAAAPVAQSGSITSNSIMWLGELGASNYYGNYQLANFQIYNTTLSANDIQAMYIAGIGGPPLVLQNLVGWWPLNGDAKDYSGNGNNGYVCPCGGSLSFSNQWASGYTPP